MELISPGWMTLANFLADFGQFLFGFVAAGLAVYTATVRWKDVFRSELQRRQFDELVSIRHKLHEVFFDFYYLPSIRSTMELMKWNIDELKSRSPDDWDQYKRYNQNSIDLFYKFQSPDYFLFPKWLDISVIQKFSETMKKVAPFTILSSTSQTEEERHTYMNEILSVISHLDVQLRAHG